jgi:hypothetical protein
MSDFVANLDIIQSLQANDYFYIIQPSSTSGLPDLDRKTDVTTFFANIPTNASFGGNVSISGTLFLGNTQWSQPDWNANSGLSEILNKPGNFVGDSGTGGASGFVPAPAAGDAAAQKYLRADGSWAVLPSISNNALIVQGVQGAQGATGPTGPMGANGRTILSGSGSPSSNTGANGDFYIDDEAWAIYGPKSSGAWPSSVTLIGPQGVQGNTGPQGNSGNTILNGNTTPALSTGNIGDFYLDTYSLVLYGPKAFNYWGNGVPLSTEFTQADWNASSGPSEILNKPTIPSAQVNSDWTANTGVAAILHKPSLSTVATSGSYTDLINRPSLAAVALSGSYTDLFNTPTFANSSFVDTTNAYNITTGTIGPARLPTPTATTLGAVESLVASAHQFVTGLSNSGVFVTAQPAASDITGLATVATSGSYTDLSNRPTIPAAQINSDWNASSGVTQILNKPILVASATTDTTNAANITSNTLAAARLPIFSSSANGAVQASGGGSTNFLRADGSWTTITTGSVTGLAASATTDTTNAANISSNTLSAARLPIFSSSANGAVQSSGGGTTNFLRADGSWAIPPGVAGGSNTQFLYNSSGSISGASGHTWLASGNNVTVTAQHTTDIPFVVAGIASQTANLVQIANSSTVLVSISATGVISGNGYGLTSIPNASVTGLVASATTDTTNAANISSGTLSASRLPSLSATYVATSQLAVNSGVATLDTSGKLTQTQIPASLVGAVVYQGVWNANTNSPSLTSGTGTKGNYYKVSVAGTTSIDGNAIWNIGDTVIFDGTTWDKIDGNSPEVLSVAGLTGAIVGSSLKSALSITTSDVSGLAASATTDTTNAANISSNTLAAARLPIFSSSANGAVQSSGGGTTNFLRADGTWTTVPTGSITGLATSATTDTTNASNITSGSLSTSRLSSSSVTLGTTAMSLGSSYTSIAGAISWTGQHNFTSNASLTANGFLFFNGNSDTNWRIGYGIGALTTSHVGQNTSIQIVHGSGSGGPDGFAIGPTGSAAAFEIVGQTSTVYVTGAGGLVIGTSSVNSSGVFSGNGYGLTSIQSSHVSGLAASATTDTTNAANISSNTLAAARLPLFSSSANGAVQASGGGTTNFLRADGSWAVPSGTGGPGGSNTQVQYNSSGALTGAAGLTYLSSGNNVTVTSQHVGDVPLIVAGIASQTANLVQIANSSAVMLSVSATGVLTGNGYGLTSIPNASVTGLAASATTDTTNAANISSNTLAAARLPIFSSSANGAVQSSGGGTTNFLRADGSWAVPAAGGSNTQVLYNNSGVISGAAGHTYLSSGNNVTVTSQHAGDVPFVVAGIASQTANLVQIANSSAVMVAVSSAGVITGNGYGLTSIPNASVTGLVASATTDTTDAANISSNTLAAARLPIFSSSANGAVQSSGGGTTNFLRADGSWAVPPGSTTPAGSNTQFQYNNSGVMAGSTGHTWLASGNNVTVTSQHTTDIPFVVAGIASQTANLVQIANSSAVMVSISSAGVITGNGYGLTSIPNASVTGLAASATTDTTNAANISSNTLAAARLPIFSSSANGAVQSSGGGTTNFLRADGSWAVPPGATTPGGSNTQIQYNNSGVMAGAAGHTYLSSGNNITVTAQHVGDVPFVVAGIASQTANLVQIANSTAVMVAISSAGVITGNGYGLTSIPNASVTGLVASATTDTTNAANISSNTLAAARLPIFSSSANGAVQSSGGGTTNFLRADGSWAVPPGSTTPAGSNTQFQYNNSGVMAGAAALAYLSSGNNVTATSQHTTDIPFVVAGIASQTANLVQIANSSAVMVSISSSGVITGNGYGLTSIPNASVTGLVASATTDTTNAANISSNTLAAGRLPLFSSSANGAVQASGGGTTNFLRADGSWAVPTGTTTPGGSNTQIQYNNSGVMAGATGHTYLSSGNNVTVTAQHTTDIPLVVAGIASQTANLVQVANSSAVMVSISSAGVLSGNGYGLTSIPNASVTGLAASATTDTTNAANISSNTLAAARLPIFSSSANGAVQSSGGGTTNFLRADGSWAVPPGSTTPGGSNTQIQYNNSGVMAGATGYTYLSSGNNVTVIAQHTTDIPFVVAGIASQTANLFQIANSSAVMVAVSSAGVITGNGYGLTSIPNASVTGLAASATTDTTNAANISSNTLAVARLPIFSSSANGAVQSSGGGTTNFLRADGSWAVPPGSTTPGGSNTQFQYNNSGVMAGAAALAYLSSGNNVTLTAQHTTDIPFVVAGIASQTANLVQIANSSAVMVAISSTGVISGNGNSLTSINGSNIVAASIPGSALITAYVPTTTNVLTSGLATGGAALSANVTITVPAANSANTTTGTDASSAVTPAGLAGADIKPNSLRAAQGYVVNSANCNAIITTGLYQLTGTLTNAPGSDTGPAFMYVIANSGGTYVTQEYINESTNASWSRVNNNGSWTSWLASPLGPAANTDISTGTDTTKFATASAIYNAGVAYLNKTAQSLTGGARVTAYSITTGSTTIDPGNGPYQYITNGAAFTITAPSYDGGVDLEVVNNSSAGSITFTGFTVNSSTGDSLTTTNSSKFIISIRRINGTSTYYIKALQ